MLKNRFFEFVEPIRWFKAVGTSDSNTWLGASRMIDTVHEATTTQPGDQLHVLVGGTFLVREDGSIESGTLRLRKPAFEKSYGPGLSDMEVAERMVESGRCREIEKPTTRAEFSAYNESRVTVSENRMARHIGQVSPKGQKRSPLLEEILAACLAAEMGRAVGRAKGKWSLVDVGEDGADPTSMECSVVVQMPDGKRLSISASPMSRRIRIYDAALQFGAAMEAVGAEMFEIDPKYVNAAVTDVDKDDLQNVVEAVADFVRNDRVFTPFEAPRPTGTTPTP